MFLILKVFIFYFLLFIPKYFIHVDTVVNGIFLILHSLWVYRNTIDFCTLLLYPVTLLNSFISFNIIVDAFRSLYEILLSVNRQFLCFVSSLSTSLEVQNLFWMQDLIFGGIKVNIA